MNHWAAAQYCDDFSTADPALSGGMDWAATGRKYLRLCNWARNRYTDCGQLVTFNGNEPAPFTRIERAAWRKYMA
jgi:hypothetical protein